MTKHLPFSELAWHTTLKSEITWDAIYSSLSVASPFRLSSLSYVSSGVHFWHQALLGRIWGVPGTFQGPEVFPSATKDALTRHLAKLKKNPLPTAPSNVDQWGNKHRYTPLGVLSRDDSSLKSNLVLTTAVKRHSQTAFDLVTW